LLGLATALLVVHALTQLRWGARPTELTYRVDLNRAGRAELLQLPGVGEHLAERIERYRDEHGGFHSVDELTNVHGIGATILERIRPCVYIRSEDAGDRPLEPARLVKKSVAKQAGGRKKGTNLTRPVDLNRATEAELREVPGLGPVLSKRIIEERGKGPFRSVEDLTRVPGIKRGKLEQVRPYVTVGDEPIRVASGP
jgi:competence ComEA-like helix-hairpin-helix protein